MVNTYDSREPEFSHFSSRTKFARITKKGFPVFSSTKIDAVNDSIHFRSRRRKMWKISLKNGEKIEIVNVSVDSDEIVDRPKFC